MCDETNRFKPLARFKWGVYYKGSAPKVYETPEEQALAEVAARKWNHYQENYVPLENYFMAQTEKENAPGAYKMASGAAASAGANEFSRASQQASQSLASRGINPNSGAFGISQGSISASQGASTGTNMARAQTAQQTRYVGGLSNIAAMGRGNATEAQQGMTDIAANAQRDAINAAESSWNSTAARRGALGTVAGGISEMYFNSPDKETKK